MTETVLSVMVLKAFGSFCNVLFLYCRKVRPHGNHYSSMIAHPQPFLTNQMTMSTHQPINIGIAHVVWPQPAANKRTKPCVNRYAGQTFTSCVSSARHANANGSVVLPTNRGSNFSQTTNVQNLACQSPKMADTAKNVQGVEEEEARCPEEGHTAREEQGTGRVEESCCTVGHDCEELPALQGQKRPAMVISELASPTVSVISISSDEEEGAQGHSLEE